MKARFFAATLGMAGISAVALALSTPERIPWLITALVCFGGIFIFDSYNEITKTWMNTIVFLATYAIVIQAVGEVAVESFWRDFAGAIFLMALLFEENSLPWSGIGPFRTTVTPALIFFLFVLAQNIPFLDPETNFEFCLIAILISAYLEVFCILRENNDMNSGSFMSAMRSAVSGVCILFYCAVFLPGVARNAPFNILLIVLPGVALGVSLLGVLLKHWRRRYILFCCNWSLFIFWAALSGEPKRFFASIGALVAGVWAIMMTNKKTTETSDTKDLYLKLSAWGVPGSLLFSMIVFSLMPSDSVLVRRGCALWLLSFFVYWSGLRKFEFPKKAERISDWNWRNGLALVVTIIGAGLLAGAKTFSDLMFQWWGVMK